MKHLDGWRGETFRRLRESTGTTAAALALELGVTEDRVLRWEADREVPHGHTRELLEAWLAQHPPGSTLSS